MVDYSNFYTNTVAEKKSFQSNFMEYVYTVYSIEGNDSLSIDLGVVGDLAIINQKIWVRYPEEWHQCTEGTDKKGRPLQKHPNIPRRLLYETEWKTDKIQIKMGKYFVLLK